MTDKDINNLPIGTGTAEAGTVAKIETVAPAEKVTAEDEAKTGIIYSDREEIYQDYYVFAFSTVITKLFIVLSNIGKGNNYIEYNQKTKKNIQIEQNEYENIFTENTQTGTFIYKTQTENLMIKIELLEYAKFKNMNIKNHLKRLIFFILLEINKKCIREGQLINDTVTLNISEIYKFFKFKSKKNMSEAINAIINILPNIKVTIEGSIFKKDDYISYTGTLFSGISKEKYSYIWNIHLSKDKTLPWNKIFYFNTFLDNNCMNLNDEALSLYLMVNILYRTNENHKTYNNTGTIPIKKFCLENGISLNTKNIRRDITNILDKAIEEIEKMYGERYKFEYANGEDKYKGLKEFIEQDSIKYTVIKKYNLDIKQKKEKKVKRKISKIKKQTTK